MKLIDTLKFESRLDINDPNIIHMDFKVVLNENVNNEDKLKFMVADSKTIVELYEDIIYSVVTPIAVCEGEYNNDIWIEKNCTYGTNRELFLNLIVKDKGSNNSNPYKTTRRIPLNEAVGGNKPTLMDCVGALLVNYVIETYDSYSNYFIVPRIGHHKLDALGLMSKKSYDIDVVVDYDKIDLVGSKENRELVKTVVSLLLANTPVSDKNVFGENVVETKARAGSLYSYINNRAYLSGKANNEQSLNILRSMINVDDIKVGKLRLAADLIQFGGTAEEDIVEFKKHVKHEANNIYRCYLDYPTRSLVPVALVHKTDVELYSYLTNELNLERNAFSMLNRKVSNILEKQYDVLK